MHKRAKRKVFLYRYMLNYTYIISEPLEYADYKIEIFKVGTGETGAERVIKAGTDEGVSKPGAISVLIYIT